MASSAEHLDQLAIRTREGFERGYGASPTHIAAAPGRVNLIGDHTDYNDGLVLPMAIDRHTVVALDREGEEDSILLETSAFPERVSFSSSSPRGDDEPAWSQYVLGVMNGYAELGVPLAGLRLWIDSDVPVASGLSSSAALEVATATALQPSSPMQLDAMARARLCQRAEHEYAGVPCGIMDQVACIFAQAGHAVLLDCQSLEIKLIPFSNEEVAVLIIDSAVPRALASSEYAVRRQQCEEAAAALGVTLLRDVSTKHLDSRLAPLDPLLRSRVRHVVCENARVQEAAEAMWACDWGRLGELMWQSHASLRDDYEVSCAELDMLVEIARDLGPENGVLGSRMTGAGFGGCTVTLVREGSAEEVAKEMITIFLRRSGIEARSILTSAAPGAVVLPSE